MMQKSTIFTTIFRVKKCYFHYDFACKKVPLSLRYARKLNESPFLSDCYQILYLIWFDFCFPHFLIVSNVFIGFVV
jgi:hypothetical protein